MISYDIDPTLHSGEPHEPKLDDGFSPPEPATSDPRHLPVEPELEPGMKPTASEPRQMPHHPQRTGTPS